MVNYDRLNAGIVSWSNDTGNDLRQSIIEQGIRHSDKSKSPKAAAESLKVRTPKRAGRISRVSYSIPRHMIYVHKGVGRGTKNGQQGNTKRVAKEWFNPVIEKNIDKLADIVAEETGDIIVNNILIK